MYGESLYFVEFNKDLNVELGVLSYPEYNKVWFTE